VVAIEVYAHPLEHLSQRRQRFVVFGIDDLHSLPTPLA
jgi:hypothetical protein